MKDKKIELIKLSASAVKTYDQCPKKYYFNYIERAPRKTWAHFDLGNICHETLEEFHKYYMEFGTTKKSLTKIMGDSFLATRKKFKSMKSDQLNEAKELLVGYLNIMKKKGMPNVKGVEAKFKFNITDTILIRGFLDRLDITKDGKFHIVDYKTTKNPKYLDKFQLLVYGLWLKKEYPDVESFTGSYVLLRHGSKLKSYEFNIEDVDKIRKDLIAYAEKIRNENIWTPVPSPLCNWCDFKNICPTQKSW